MVSSAARVGSINVLLQTQLGPGIAGLNTFATAVDRTGASVTRGVAGIDRSIGGLNRSLGNINTRGMTSLTLGALRAGTALDQLRGFALAAGVAVGGLMPAAIAAGMIRTVDGAHRLSNQLRTVTTDANDLKNTQDALFDVAQRTRSAFDSTVTIYARTARATEHLGLSQQKLLRITETVQKAFAVGGASTAEAQGAAIQLSQGIASNRFSGEEFRSVAENAPVLLRGMAESLGVNIGKLREMAHAGELTADVVTKAILDASRKIDEDFAKTTSTIEQAWVRVGNAVTKYAMDSQGASAASASIVTVLNALAAHIDTVADSLMLLGVAFASVLGGRKGMAAIAGTAGFIKDLRTMRAETLANAESAKKAANAEALAAATRARELRQNVIATSRGRKDELGEMRAAMLKANADKAIAAEQQMAAAAQKSGEVRAAADAKAAAAKADATQKWSHFMAVARQEKKEAVESARAALAAAEAQKVATQTRLTGAQAYYEMSKAAGVSQKTQIKAGKDLQAALQADLKATNAVAVAQNNLQAALDGTAKKSRTYLAAQKAVEAAKKQVVATTAAAAAAELKHTEAVAAHVAAQRTAQAAIVSGNLTKEQEAALNKRAEVLERKVAAAKAQSAAATLAARDAARAATAATTQLAAAQQAASARAMAMAAAGRAVSAAWSFIGGPLGAAMLALGAAMYVQSRHAAIAQERSDRYAEAIKKAGENSSGASPGIKQVAADLFSVGAGATEAARQVSLMNAQARESASLDSLLIRLGALKAQFEFAGREWPAALDPLIQQFRNGEITAEQFGAELDKIASANPNLSKIIADMQRLANETDAARGEIAGVAEQIEKLDGKEAKVTITIGTRTIELTDGGVAAKGDRPGASAMDKAAEDMRQNMLLLGRSGWDDLFKFPKDKKERKAGAPRKTADDRFDNSVQAIYDRIEALRLEREMLGATYYEQVKREEILKLEQEALKQAREEARKKNDADWQSAQISEEKKQKIREVAEELAREADAHRKATEAMQFQKDVMKDVMSGLREALADGKITWEELGDIAIRVLDKIINKIEDELIDAIFRMNQEGTSGGGGGGILGLLGGLFGGFSPTSSLWRPNTTAGAFFTSGFAPGGYTGDGGKYQPAGIVHAGEYVFNQDAVRRIGVDNLEALHNAATQGYADGGHVGRVISGVSTAAGNLRDNGGSGGGRSVIEVVLSPELLAKVLAEAKDQSIAIVRGNNRARESLYQNGGTPR